MERRGVSRSVPMKLTGHKTEHVYKRYAIVSEQDLREAVRRLEAPESGHNCGHNGPGELDSRAITP